MSRFYIKNGFVSNSGSVEASMNHHLILKRTVPAPGDAWQCTDCDDVGTYDELTASEFSHESPPPTCCAGDPGSNLCAEDCPLMRALTTPVLN